jgi:hypothetical protein
MAGVVSVSEKAGRTRQVRAGKTNVSEPLVDERDSQIIREEAQGIEKDALLAKRAGEHRVNLVNHEHADIELTGQHPHPVS